MVDKQDLNLKLRRPLLHEHQKQNRVIEAAWRVAYAHIYTPDEIDAVFRNRFPQIASWVNNRAQRLGNLLAESNGQIVGTSGRAKMDNGDGELSSLYVLPQFQGRGVGLALWERALNDFRESDFKAMQVWTLARSAAVNFYEAQGCYRYGEGTYRVGTHIELAIGFRIDL